MRACWRVRACAAGLCVGAQIFLFGSGIAMPVALGSAWIAALAALPAAALTTAVCRKKLDQDFLQREKEHPRKDRRGSRILHALLALTLLLNAAFALGALVSLAEQTLLRQARAAWSMAVALAAAALCALTGGAPRLCFALRWGLAALLLGLTAACVPMELPVGLFPILGAGPLPLGVAAVCMLGAASPLLMLMLPPPELALAGAAAQRCPLPETKFFLGRVLAGAAVGVLLLFVASVCTTYESIAESGEWGVRLRIVFGAQPHEGIPQTLLTVCQMIAVVLLAACMLGAAEQALVRAWPKAQKGRAGLAALTLLLALCLAALIVYGFTPALFIAPLLAVPLAVLLIFYRRMGGNDA